MRVAVVTRRFPTSHETWAGHSGYQTVRLLAQRCDLRVFYPEGVYPPLLSTPSRTLPIDRTWNPFGVDVSYIPYPAIPIVTRPINGWVIAQRLLPHVRRFNPDIIFNYFIYPDGYAAIRIARALKIPAVLTAVGSDLNSMPDRLIRMITRSTLRSADFVTTVSQDLCKTAGLLGADPARCRARLNGCDTSIFHPTDRAEARKELALDPDADILVYAGRLDVRKGLIELIEAISRLTVTRPNLRCYLIGDGPDKAPILSAISRLNIGKSVTIIHSCPTWRVAIWMNAANLVTLPSYNEGCPNVVIEALACGRPVVATLVGGIPELMDYQVGRLVPPKDVSALTHALEEVLTETWDPIAISSLRGRSWQDVADDVYAVLEETLNK
jgi:teichuronic acid biosynthesis glycosyltransferase TuaC